MNFVMFTNKQLKEEKEIKVKLCKRVVEYLRQNKKEYWLRRIFNNKTLDGRYQVCKKINIV